MRERERELIAALAEGSLEDETEARALLDASPEAEAEFQLQLAALDALSVASPVEMTELERAQLNRDLWARLRAEKVKTRSAAGVYGWSLAAAALFVVVGLAAVLGGGILNLAQSGEDSTEATTSASDEASQETMEAADADTFAEGDGGAAAMPSPSAQSFFEEQAERLRRGDTLRGSAAGTDSEDDAACLQRAGLTDHMVAAVLDQDDTAPIEGRHLAAVPSGEEIGPETPVHFVETETCERVYTSAG